MLGDYSQTLMTHGPWIVFVFLFGACVGSFINVVNWRMPRGMSLSHPPSRCPICGGRLRFFRENLPILGWILLKGKCRYCRARIHPVYPITEFVVALAFVGLYYCLFMSTPSQTWWWEVGGQWWVRQGFLLGWPAFFAVAFLFVGLYSITVIDARTFMIPLAIPVFITCAAVVLWCVQAFIARNSGASGLGWPIPGTGWMGTGAAIGGMLGIGVSMVLQMAGVFRPSFADYEQYVPEGEVLAEYPFARREMGIELLFLTPVIMGIVLGAVALGWIEGVPPRWLQAVGGSLLGYLVGGGLVWGVRILGTLAFGREAMGLGDVHLLAAVGAVFGWFLPIMVFFVAPFIGLAWTVAVAISAKCRNGVQRELPYGPHLAVATLLLFFGRPVLIDGWRVLMPTVEMPNGGFATPVDNSSDWTTTLKPCSMSTDANWYSRTDGTTER
ncbi:MAG: prepilin peptidase [Phycisphaerales bacterium]|jgi:leader peptidase (prepilin peptidase) / N-methyltransferase|nr:prepilin peptidase [Phycisphaerales bacterium]